MNKLTRRFVVTALGLAVGLSVHMAHAQQGDAVRVVVPTLPGGATDAVARMVTDRLTADLKRTVLVDNRAGAGGSLGSSLVAQAKPDGDTLLFTMSGPISTVPHVIKTIKYGIDDFKPIAVVFRTPFLILVPANSPYKSAQELIEAGKPGPGKVMPAYGSAGVGAMSHIGVEMLNRQAGTAFLHIPYKGTAETLRSLLSNEVAWGLVSTQDGKAMLDAGQLKALAILGTERSPAHPNVPTTTELGFKNLNLSVWYSLYAPAKIPDETARKLSEAVSKIVQDPTFIARVNALGGEVPKDRKTSDAILAELRKESAEIKEVVQALDIKNE